MDSSTISTLNLHLAWQRMKGDRPHRAFYTHPRLIEWLESDLEGWFTSIRKRLSDGYAPHTSLTCAVPKPGWLVRPGALLDEQDELVMNALVGTFYKKAYENPKSFQGDPDVAYQLQPDETRNDWLKTGFRIWTEWRIKSLKKLRTSQFVVIADIAGFYENIDLQRLSSDLKSFSADAEILALLMSLLNKWAHPRAKGIPQGFSAADILAKIHLNPIDRALRNSGFVHLRYVDDIRIFCKSRLEAKRGLLMLNDLVRKRGLNLQSAKTKIVRADDALHDIDGVTNLIQAIQSQLVLELQDDIPDPSSVTVSEIQNFFSEHPASPPPEVLERAFTDSFESGGEKFNKTLLHYLLTRLGKVKSRVAVDYAAELIQQRPEETEAALRYLGEVEPDELTRRKIIDYIASPEAIYGYQIFQILAWFQERGSIPAELVTLCRGWSGDKNTDLWVRMSARAILGKEGDRSDLEAIESSYESRLGDLECADILDAVAGMEPGRRNSFYGRVSSDGDLVSRSIRRVRGSKAGSEKNSGG